MSDPVYLVSRCSSVEEFVAAFRRYADRLGIFVPAAAPVPVGRKSRFAITLSDGSVMIDGDAEVIMSSSRATGLHGRPGMVLRFSKVDDDSKAVLDHLDKVRFGAKISASSTHLRPRSGTTPPALPPSPQTSMPVSADPAQALAECVVVGTVAPPPSRSKSTSAPPRVAAQSEPNAFQLPTRPQVGPGVSGGVRQTMMGGLGEQKLPATPSAPIPAATTTPSTAANGSGPTAAPAAPAAQPTTVRGVAPVGGRGSDRTGAAALAATIESGATTTRTPALDLGPAPLAGADSDRTHTGSVKPTDGVPAPATMAVTVAGGAATAPSKNPVELDAVPVPAISPWLRMTTRGVAPPGARESEPLVVSMQELRKDPTPPPAPELPPPEPSPPVLPPPARVPGARAKTIMGIQALQRSPAGAPPMQQPSPPELAPTAGSQPMIATPPAPPPDAFKPESTVEVDPSLFEGGAPPVEVRPTASARSRPITDNVGFFNDTGPAPVIHDPGGDYLQNGAHGFFRETGAVPLVGAQTGDQTALVDKSKQKRMLVIALSALGALIIAFITMAIVSRGAKNKRTKPAPAAAASPSGSAAAPSGSEAALAPTPAPPTPTPAPPTPAPEPVGSGAGSGSDTGDYQGATIVTDKGEIPVKDDGKATPPPPDGAKKVAAAQPAADCPVKVTSSPSGAEVVVGGKARGKTPVEVKVVCKPTTVTVRHSRYASWSKKIKPGSRTTKVTARLERPTFTVKVSSVPSGATISVGGKKLGKTPTQIKIPGYQPSTIVLSKDGWSSQSERVTPKQNGTAIKMTLRKR